MPTQLNLLKREWCEDAGPIVIRMMRGAPFTSDDVREYLTPPKNNNYFGVLFATLKNKGLIKRIGYQPSKRPEANGRPVAVWNVI